MWGEFFAQFYLLQRHRVVGIKGRQRRKGAKTTVSRCRKREREREMIDKVINLKTTFFMASSRCKRLLLVLVIVC